MWAKRMTAFLILTIAAIAAAGDQRVSIKVVEDARAIECRVPIYETNLWLDMGVVGYFAHGKQLNGMPSDGVTHHLQIPGLQCEEGETHAEAFCELWIRKGSDRDVQIAKANVPCLP